MHPVNQGPRTARRGRLARGLGCLLLALACLPLLASCAGAQFLPGPGGGWTGSRPRAVPLRPPGPDTWEPDRQYKIVREDCQTARTTTDLDGCQYWTENLIENLENCVRRGDARAPRCAELLPGAREQLAQVNSNPDLQEHRADQREGQRRAGASNLCAQQNGGYYMGGYWSCMRSYGFER